jgi:hypothetical protein
MTEVLGPKRGVVGHAALHLKNRLCDHVGKLRRSAATPAILLKFWQTAHGLLQPTLGLKSSNLSL